MKKILFQVLCLCLFFTSLHALDRQEFNQKVLPNLVLGQEQKWQDFQLKILTSHKTISLVFPLDIYIFAYNPNLDLPFTGKFSLALESLGARSYRETTLQESDQIAPGIYKITYPFEQVGDYTIKANFFALDGSFTQLESRVEVKPSQSLMNYQKSWFMTLIMVAATFAVIYLVKRRRGK